MEPKTGHVFRNRLGRPHTDTRQSRIQGGNPLKRAHETACRRAGIPDFRVHDGRHHWASWCVMSGVDLITLQRMGGWGTLRMVQRYTALNVEHMVDAIRRLA